MALLSPLVIAILVVLAVILLTVLGASAVDVLGLKKYLDEGWEWPSSGAQPTSLFAASRELKKGIDVEAIREKEDAEFGDGFFGSLAKNKTFEAITIFVITLNAIEIGWDADYTARFGKPDNLFDGPVGFIICEVAFCIYFTGEILIRFFGFRKTWRCILNRWFVFDSILVGMMIFETAILPILGNSGPFGQLSTLRLLRLLRMTRMAKLMRAFPQILMIIKGMNAAVRAVGWVFILLVLVSFTWSILFVNEYHQGLLEDDDVEEEIHTLFGSMGKAMLSLMVMGTILDDVTYCTDTIRATENTWMLAMFLVYVVLNSFTMMNLLVGILVEVVASTAEGEKVKLAEEAVKDNISSIFNKIDEDGSGEISKTEFDQMGDPNFEYHEAVMTALEELDIKSKHFSEYGKLLFDGKDEDVDPTINFDDMLDVICRLRPGAHVSALDFGTFKEFMVKSSNSLQARVDRVAMLTKWLGEQDSVGGKAEKSWPPDEEAKSSPRLGDVVLQELRKLPRTDLLTELRRRFDDSGHLLNLPKASFAMEQWTPDAVLAC